jgi:hypothetical protein
MICLKWKKYFFLLKIWFSVKLVFIFAPRKTFFYTRNLLRKVEGIDPAKPWQPANRNVSKVPNSTPKFGKDKSEISLK